MCRWAFFECCRTAQPHAFRRCLGEFSLVVDDHATILQSLQYVGKIGLELNFTQLRHRIGRPREETVIIGDNLATDIAAGHNAGLRSTLILTGISTRTEAEAAERPPHWIAEDYGTLERQLFGH